MLSFSPNASEKMRSALVCSLSPAWQSFNALKLGALHLLQITPLGPRSVHAAVEVENLRQENQLFHTQMENVRQWLLCEDRIQEQLVSLKEIAQYREQNPHLEDFFRRRAHLLAYSLELQLQSLLARVVYREPASWSSVIWLNVGAADNLALGREVVAKNSPVLVGTSIVGVVEYVGTHQCRVRLITDSRIAPSVRVARGKEQNRYLLEHLEALSFSLERRDDLFSTSEEAHSLLQALSTLKAQLIHQGADLYLAKGELLGTSLPLWRSRGSLLKGVGFNYDFADAEGPARDLRTKEDAESPNGSILKAGDLLVTSGLDGVFPAGLRVAIVSSVGSLKEGASSYELEARPSAGNLSELTEVFVLPPIR
jgi:cell shape-determining protein MreC